MSAGNMFLSLPSGWKTHELQGKGMILQAKKGETGNLLEIRDDSGVLKAYITHAGVLVVPEIQSTTETEGNSTVTGDQTLGGDLLMATGKKVKVNSVQVLAARVTGFTPCTGTAVKAGLNASLALGLSTIPTLGELTAVANAVIECRQVVAALQAAMESHGQIGA